MRRWLIIIAVLWNMALWTPAAESAPAGEGHRYLFLIDTATGMGRFKAAIEKTVQDLVSTGMNGEMQMGDAFAIWPYRDKVVSDAFAPETWVPPLKDQLTKGASDFVRQLKYEGTSLFYVALVESFRVVKASKSATILLISDGTEMLQGTPFDLYANKIYGDHAMQMRKEKKPFVTVLLAVDGKIIGCTVSFGGDTITLPPMPTEMRAQLLADRTAAARSAPPAKLATQTAPAPAPKAIVQNVPKKAVSPKGSSPSTPPVERPPTPTPRPPMTVSATPIPAPPQSTQLPASPAPPVEAVKPAAPAPPPAPATPAPEVGAKISAGAVTVAEPPPQTEGEPKKAAPATLGQLLFEQHRLLLIGLGLLVVAALIGWTLIRGNRGPKRPSLISRSMGR